MDNKAIAALFREMGELLDIRGGDPYRARAFRRVSHILEELPEPAQEALSFGTLQRRRGVGEGTVFRIRQILRTGTCADLDRLRAQMPSGVRELLQIDGLGPKSVRLIHRHLGVGSIEELEAAALTGRLARLPRFGARSADRILEAIADHRRRSGRTPLAEALRIGQSLVDGMAADPVVRHVALAGSARRRKALVGDLDVLVATLEPAAAAARFCALPEVADVLLRGEGRASVRLQGGQRADLRVLLPDTFGAGLHYFTGSKRHNIAVRIRGNKRGLKISEHGVLTRREERFLAGAAEVDIFAAVGLPYIPPELREDDGELQAAERGQLPLLVEERQLRGDLNVHTLASDGRGSLAAMARAAAASGLRYLAITDHSRGPKGGGLDERGLGLQAARIRALDGKVEGLRLLAGVEVEILPDGELALDRGLLASLDWVVAAAHHALDQDRRAFTDRIVRAVESGVVDCIAHPTGRLLRGRDGAALDLIRLLAAARRAGVALEINADPRRLDLDAAGCRRAREMGVALVIGSGAHAPDQLEQRRLGVYTARRGWLRAADLLNTLSFEELLERRRARVARASQLAGSPSVAAAPEPTTSDSELRAALAQPPLPTWLCRQLEDWLRSPDDPAITDALADLCASRTRADNPIRLALELLWRSKRRPQARVRPLAPDEDASDDGGEEIG